MPTADTPPFAPKPNLKTAKLVASQHLLSGGITHFSGSLDDLRNEGFMRGEVMHVVDTLIGSALLKRVNLNDALYNNGALIKSFKAEALLALLVCRPCSVHYKLDNACYVPYIKNQSHRLVTEFLFWKASDIDFLVTKIQDEFRWLDEAEGKLKADDEADHQALEHLLKCVEYAKSQQKYIDNVNAAVDGGAYSIRYMNITSTDLKTNTKTVESKLIHVFSGIMYKHPVISMDK